MTGWDRKADFSPRTDGEVKEAAPTGGASFFTRNREGGKLEVDSPGAPFPWPHFRGGPRMRNGGSPGKISCRSRHRQKVIREMEAGAASDPALPPRVRLASSHPSAFFLGWGGGFFSGALLSSGGSVGLRRMDRNPRSVSDPSGVGREDLYPRWPARKGHARDLRWRRNPW